MTSRRPYQAILVGHTTRIDRAWAAGFFDGEGCFSLSTRDSRISANISQIDVRPLNRFKEAMLGMGHIRGPYAPSGNRLTKKPLYIYQCGRLDQVLTIMGLLWPYMGEPKKEQAARVMLAVFARQRLWTNPRFHSGFE